MKKLEARKHAKMCIVEILLMFMDGRWEFQLSEHLGRGTLKNGALDAFTDEEAKEITEQAERLAERLIKHL